MKTILGCAAVAAICALAAAAQDNAMEKNMVILKQRLEKTATMVSLEGGVMSAVKGAPYSADQVTETTQTLADGTRIHNERTVTIYRDGQGRLRRESGDTVTIWDPVAGANYTLNTRNQTASTMHVSVNTSLNTAKGPIANYFFVTGDGAQDAVRFKVQADTAQSLDAAKAQALADSTKRLTEAQRKAEIAIVQGQLSYARTKHVENEPKTESLGQQTMEGVNATGERQTSTIPTGDIGNDRPIDVVSERWYSPDLQTEVMSRETDPRTGERVMRLINIRRGEPDPSLFQVPAGYTVNDPKSVPLKFTPSKEQQ